MQTWTNCMQQTSRAREAEQGTDKKEKCSPRKHAETRKPGWKWTETCIFCTKIIKSSVVVKHINKYIHAYENVQTEAEHWLNCLDCTESTNSSRLTSDFFLNLRQFNIDREQCSITQRRLCVSVLYHDETEISVIKKSDLIKFLPEKSLFH